MWTAVADQEAHRPRALLGDDEDACFLVSERSFEFARATDVNAMARELGERSRTRASCEISVSVIADKGSKTRPSVAVVVVLALFTTRRARLNAGPFRKNENPHRPPQIVKIVCERGSSPRDAGIGAAVAGLSVVGLTAGSLLLLRLHRPRPKT